MKKTSTSSLSRNTFSFLGFKSRQGRLFPPGGNSSVEKSEVFGGGRGPVESAASATRAGNRDTRMRRSPTTSNIQPPSGVYEHGENALETRVRSLGEFRAGGTAVDPNTACCPIVENWYIWIIWWAIARHMESQILLGQ